MSEQKIEAHKITKPIQLLAVWFVALVVLVGALLGAAALVTAPIWIPAMLSVAAVVFVPAFLVAAFVMQTRFRAHLQDDPYYADWLKRQEEKFAGFTAENLDRPEGEEESASRERTYDEYEERRVKRYQAQKGVFLIHAWRPSKTEGQIADIVIWLHQHRDGPLSQGAVEKVEYHLGPMFFEHVVTKYNAHEVFKLEVSAYGPMLCSARAFIRGEDKPIELERYIDFEEAPRT
ncbi:MAG: pYEATS domain-containing protein [Planctomycetota bacterium]|jgi:hypothetical protein